VPANVLDRWLRHGRDTQDPGIAPRGPIDIKASSAHRSALASLGYHATAVGDSRHGNVFSEDRGNGTPAVTNNTAARSLSGETLEASPGDSFRRDLGGTQGYDQTFSAVAADRTSEDLNRLQHVPTGSLAGQSVDSPFGRHTVSGALKANSFAVKRETQLSRGRVLGVTEAAAPSVSAPPLYRTVSPSPIG